MQRHSSMVAKKPGPAVVMTPRALRSRELRALWLMLRPFLVFVERIIRRKRRAVKWQFIRAVP